MRRLKIRFAVLALIETVFFFNGCFTEVGNPDDPKPSVVTTEFLVDYQSYPPGPEPKTSAAYISDSIAITYLSLNAYDAEYFTTDGNKYSLLDAANKPWDNIYDRQIVFAGPILKPLPAIHAQYSNWNFFYLTIRTDSARSPIPGTLTYADFQNKHVMKGTLVSNGLDVDFLFEIPSHRRIFMDYRDSSLSRIYSDNIYHLKVAFRAQYFRSGIPWDSLVTKVDQAGKTYAVISSKENSGLYARACDNFIKAFDADSTLIEGSVHEPWR